MGSRVGAVGRALAGVGLCLALLPAAALAPESPRAVLAPESPGVAFDGLFDAVERAPLFKDSKTFADAVPKFPPSEILARYRDAKPNSNEALVDFVAANFSLPAEAGAPPPSTER